MSLVCQGNEFSQKFAIFSFLFVLRIKKFCFCLAVYLFVLITIPTIKPGNSQKVRRNAKINTLRRSTKILDFLPSEPQDIKSRNLDTNYNMVELSSYRNKPRFGTLFLFIRCTFVPSLSFLA